VNRIGGQPWLEAVVGAPKSVTGILHQQRVGVELRLRNRHQDKTGTPGLLERPRLSVPAVTDEILPPLRLGRLLQSTATESLPPISLYTRGPVASTDYASNVTIYSSISASV